MLVARVRVCDTDTRLDGDALPALPGRDVYVPAGSPAAEAARAVRERFGRVSGDWRRDARDFVYMYDLAVDLALAAPVGLRPGPLGVARVYDLSWGPWWAARLYRKLA